MATLLLCLGSVMADVSSLSKSYLPPHEGYNYNPPNVPFPSPSPAPSYRPPGTIAPRPPPPPPNYATVAPLPPYSPQVTYRPPPIYSTPKPTYVPPPSPPNYDYEGSAISPVTGPGSAGAGTGGGEFDHLQQPHVPGMPFDFNYAVKDDYYGTDFGHQAVSNGDQVRGEYRVALPDGRLQIVKYLADWKDGYTAEVTYQGEAKYPTGPGASGGSLGAGSGYPGGAVVRPQPSPYPSPSYPQPGPSYPQPGPSYPVQPPSPSYPSPISPVKPSGNYPRPGFGAPLPQQPSPYPGGLPSSGYPVSAKPVPSYPASGGAQPGYGGSQSGYGSQQSDYGSQQQSGYGSQQSGYGGQQQQQPQISGYGSSPQPSYSSPAPDYGSYK